MSEKKRVVLNEFSSKEKYVGREYNSGEVLVDYTLPVPSLLNYLQKYMDYGVLANYGEEDNDDSEDFSVKDYRDSDIEDLKEYNEEMQEKVKTLKKKKEDKEIEINKKEKEQKEEKKEKDASENNSEK